MKNHSKKALVILLFLSVIGMTITGVFLPYLPTTFCIGTVYSAYALAQGHTSYTDFVLSAFQSKESEPETKPVPVSVTVPARELITPAAPAIPLSFGDVQIQNETDAEIQLEAWMENYAPPQKNTAQPQILIIHTHATEAFADCDNRSTDNSKNMTAVGEVLAKKLTEYGFSVLHDKTQHDYPNYNGSYVNALKTVSYYLEEYPSIEIVLDLHRDGIVTENGDKVRLATEYNGEPVARMMFVIGTDRGGLTHPEWQENLKFAAGLQWTLQQLHPDLMRPINIRNERFNQHVTTNTVIIECGSNGNTREEAENAVLLLADALNNYIR